MQQGIGTIGLRKCLAYLDVFHVVVGHGVLCQLVFQCDMEGTSDGYEGRERGRVFAETPLTKLLLRHL